jgi:serine/threonine protein phosphatase 1
MNYIIGDVHGLADQLSQLIERIQKKDKDANFWFVGDYCDRGPNSKNVIETIFALGDKAHCVRGNHDEVFDVVINTSVSPYSEHGWQSLPNPEVHALIWFYRQGMRETFESYVDSSVDVDLNATTPQGIRRLNWWVPEEHKKWYRNLPLYLEHDDFFVCHAHLPIDTAGPKEYLEEYPEEFDGFLWNRFDYQQEILEDKQWKKKGYFGHTPTFIYEKQGIINGPKISLVDTGAVFTKSNGALTAICHETGDVITYEK